MDAPTILFLTHPYPNYVPDLLLHGLRRLLGPRVVDFPRKDRLYRGELLGVCPENQRCPELFPEGDRDVDRSDIPSKIAKGHFTYVLCDVRALALLQTMTPSPPPRLVLIDGEDSPVRIAPGPFVICRRESDGSDGSIPLPMALPEEILRWIASYDRLPKRHSVGFLGCVGPFTGDRSAILDKIVQLYPDALVRATAIPSESSPLPAGRMGRDEYYRALQQCRTVLSLRGAGYDTFRFWENAACNAAHVSPKMPLFIPNDFEHDRDILRFTTIEELRRAIDLVLEGKRPADEIARNSRRRLADFHLTTKRAGYLLDRLARTFPPP